MAEDRVVFQVCLEGYDSITDETDHLVKWIVALSPGQVKNFLKASGMKYIGTIDEIEVDLDDPAVDYRL